MIRLTWTFFLSMASSLVGPPDEVAALPVLSGHRGAGALVKLHHRRVLRRLGQHALCLRRDEGLGLLRQAEQGPAVVQVDIPPGVLMKLPCGEKEERLL